MRHGHTRTHTDTGLPACGDKRGACRGAGRTASETLAATPRQWACVPFLRRLAGLLVLACAAAARPWGPALREAEGAEWRGTLVVEDFEAFVNGEDWAAVQFSPGADPRMRVETYAAHSGRRACRLDVPRGESLTLAAQRRATGAGDGSSFVGRGDKPPLPLPGSPERIGIWVLGQQSGHRLWVRVSDATGKAADVALGAVDFEGWRLLEAPIGGLAPPLALNALLVRGGEGPLVLDDLTVATRSDRPLHLTLRPATAGKDNVEGEALGFHVSLQSLAAEPVEGTGEVAAYDAASPGVCQARTRFRFRVSAAEPFATTLRLRLPAGIHRIVARVADGRWVRAKGSHAEAEVGRAYLHAEAVGVQVCTPYVCNQLVVYPAKPRGGERALAALKGFGCSGDALRVYESALSPAVVVETTGDSLTLFQGLAAAGLGVPEHMLAPLREGRMELREPWMLLWFGAAPEWKGVTFADGSPCPTFDVPFLVVLDHSPSSWRAGQGVELRFPRRGVRAALMPLFGIRRPDPAETTRWQSAPETMAQVSAACAGWARMLRAMPVAVSEEYCVDAERDLVEVRVRFSYLASRGGFGPPPRRVAPVPPLLMLARGAGLPVRFSREPVPTGCYTSAGPYCVVPDSDGYTYSVSGLLRFVLRAVADVPRGVPGAQVSLARNCRALSEDGAKLPFWAAHGGVAGKRASEALAAFMLAPSSARYSYEPEARRLVAWDGLVAQNHGDAAAVGAAAEFLQACWYAGLHAGHWEALRPRWRHIAAMHDALADGDDWATLGIGSRALPADVRLNAELYFARLAARLGGSDDFARACAQTVKLMVGAYALVAAAPHYAEELGPWPSLGKGRVIGRIERGSLGLAPGAPPFVTMPSDAGYAFAAEFLGDYYRGRFRSGPLDYFGRSPAEWSERLFVALDAPPLGKRFRSAEPPWGPFASNYVFGIEQGPGGWPAMVWRSHRAPAGGPLVFGSIGTAPSAEGRLLRSWTVNTSLRLSAYTATEAPRPPREARCQEPPPQMRP